MSQVSELINNYRAIRSRLQVPPNAVPDRGINLHPNRIPFPEPVDKSIKEVKENRSPINCRVCLQVIPRPPIEPVLPRKVPIMAVQRAVARVYGIRLCDLRGPCRQQWAVLPRHVAFYVSCLHTTASLPKIGLAYSGRDHTSVLHGKRKIAALILVDQQLAESVRLVEFLALGGYYDTANPPVVITLPPLALNDDSHRPAMAPIPEHNLEEGQKSDLPQPQVH